ncbi:cytochrome P450 [Annulohypoxylon maeteangense]|uniref:cytochrome P450 n=1 Tax=Annulohypoxylon maeteangense TaxID=1927788 RepID=UPI00200848FE|nr:cytochrome P450 [Annulohypoxylon maeteangense]KAI0880464.1 cytochrome P450 [Annulohypoxylon maeteangense]
MPALASYAALAAYFLGPLILFILVSRFNSHPLSKFPGPPLARFTDGYAAIHASQRRLHLATYQDHQKYGPVVRQGPNRLVFNTVTALQDIYLSQRVTKSKVYLKSLLSTSRPSMFNALDRAEHSHKRRVVGQLITERSMRLFEPTMTLKINVFLRQLLASTEKDEVVNMTMRCQRLGADVVGLLAFGYELNTQTEDTNTIIPKAMKATSYRIGLYMAWPNISFVDPVIHWLGRKQIPKFYNALRNMIGTRMSMPKDSAYDLYAVASGDITPNGEKGLQGTDLWSEASFFVMAGGMTVSTLMSAVFFYLTRHPDVYARLAAEIRTTFTSSEAIAGGPQLSSCKYLRAVIDETMRVAPPTTATPWREDDVYSATRPRSDSPWVVDGHVIPPGVAVGVSPYSMLHNEAYFPDPFAFRPERWLDGEDGKDGAFNEETRAIMRRAFVPFALGDRACAGKAMAYLETSLTIAKTLWYFDFETAPTSAGKVGGGTPGRTDGRDRVDEYQLYDIFTADHDGPNVIFRPRAQFMDELKLKNDA